MTKVYINKGQCYIQLDNSLKNQINGVFKRKFKLWQGEKVKASAEKAARKI